MDRLTTYKRLNQMAGKMLEEGCCGLFLGFLNLD